MIELYPAIDLLDGRCVRLYQGDYDRNTAYGDDPVAQAQLFDLASARVHLRLQGGGRAAHGLSLLQSLSQVQVQPFRVA